MDAENIGEDGITDEDGTADTDEPAAESGAKQPEGNPAEQPEIAAGNSDTEADGEVNEPEGNPEELPDARKGVEQAAVDRDASFRIHMALHALEEPYREVFELRIFGELSFREVGLIFGKTENWARVTYHRARLKLQERMDEHE